MEPLLRTVSLPARDLATTSVGFGTSRLHHLATSAERQRVLAAAWEAGIRHFDTAPLYGHGLAERELATFLKGRLEAVVATKVGLLPAPWIAPLPTLLMRPAIAARAVARRVTGDRDRRPVVTPALVRGTVERSLRRLGRDRIDLSLLHEPAPERVEDIAAISSTYEALMGEGKVRAWGLAGAFAPSVALLVLGVDALLQAPENDWRAPYVPAITYGALSGGAQSGLAEGGAGGDAEAARGRLAAALARRPNGVVLVSSTRPRNVAALLAG